MTENIIWFKNNFVYIWLETFINQYQYLIEEFASKMFQG